MRHFASSRFWTLYRALPEEIQRLADKNFALLESDLRHPSLHFKGIGELWSVRVGDHYRVLGLGRGGWDLLDLDRYTCRVQQDRRLVQPNVPAAPSSSNKVQLTKFS